MPAYARAPRMSNRERVEWDKKGRLSPARFSSKYAGGVAAHVGRAVMVRPLPNKLPPPSSCSDQPGQPRAE